MSIYEQDASDIIHFLKNGDGRSCNNLVKRHQNAVFGICLGVVKDKMLAEELAQDIFIKAFKKLDKLDDPRRFRAWLLRMAYRTSIDKKRKKKYHLDPIDGKHHIYDDDQSIDDRMDTDKRRELITNLIHDLGHPDSLIFTLFYMEDMTTQEISKTMGLSQSNVKIRLMRGRDKLKTKILNILKQF